MKSLQPTFSGGLAAPLLRWQLPWSCPVGCEENVANSLRAALGTAAGHRHLTKLGGFQRGVDGLDGMFGMMFLKVGSESLLLMNPFWWNKKKGRRGKQDEKKLELGGFLGGRSDFLLMFWLTSSLPMLLRRFFVGRKFSQKKTDLGNPRRNREDTRNSGSELHHWSFTTT